ncbi:MAG: DUF4233 domain-containing protein [Actinomycetes bacterium]
MRVLGSAVLAMESLIMGFALLLARNGHGGSSIWLGSIIAILLLLCAGVMKRKLGWYLGSALQIAVIAYGAVVTSMYFMGAFFASLWVAAYVVGKKGEAMRARLLAEGQPQVP